MARNLSRIPDTCSLLDKIATLKDDGIKDILNDSVTKIEDNLNHWFSAIYDVAVEMRDIASELRECASEIAESKNAEIEQLEQEIEQLK